MSKYRICYYGSSTEFLETLRVFIKKQKDLGLVLDQVDKFPTHNQEDRKTTIIIDTEIIHKDKQLLNKILKIRKSKFSSNYLFIVLENSFCKDSSQLVYFRSGINYIIVKDGDITSSLNQLFYLMVEEDFPCPKFATTRKFFAKATVETPLFVTQVDRNFINIASDIPMQDEVDVDFAQGLKLSLKREEETNNCPDSFNLYKSTFSFIEHGAWEGTSYSSWDTIETQVENFENTTQKIKHRVLLVDTSQTFKENEDLFNTFMEAIDTDVFSSKHLDMSSIRERGYRIIIIGKLAPQEDRVDFLFELVQSIMNQNIESEPMIIFPDSKSTPEALKKVIRYKKLLCFKHELDTSTLTNFIGVLAGQECLTLDTYQLGLEEKNSVCYQSTDVHITSISEFFVTFTTKEEIPLYSYVRLDIGIQLNLLIIPPLRFLNKVGGKQHYMAFVFLLSEEDLQLLRRSVNHYMFIEINEIDDKFKSYFDKKYEVIEEAPAEVKEETDQEQEQTENGTESLYEDNEEPISQIKYKKGYISKL
ncbi:hypothetical protein [Halobacteriovorax sp. HLS]|uniref:hypothetical protein n=1 Tax=Halobacteriovorax sp. HLS TaxID=2234000 RepID=UPI000FDBB81E|nr:hypothetical protein [Halobacteriovorax sp. HLS]